MKIDIELGKVKVRVPENKTDLPVNVIVGDGGSGPEPRQNKVVEYTVTEIVRRESSFIVNAEV